LQVTDPDGNVTGYEYDSSGRRTRMALTAAGTQVIDQSYTYTNDRMAGTTAATDYENVNL